MIKLGVNTYSFLWNESLEDSVKILGKASRKVEDPADWENQVKEQLADGLKLRSVYDIR